MSDQRIYRLRVAIALVGSERAADADLRYCNACLRLSFHHSLLASSAAPQNARKAWSLIKVMPAEVRDALSARPRTTENRTQP
jgi:hypothetical protein